MTQPQNPEPAFSDANRATIFAAIEAIRAALPALVSLTPEERRRMFKLGNKRLAFIRSGQRVVEQYPGILPGSFDKDKFTTNAMAVSELSDVDSALTILASQVSDTLMSMGGEVLAAALLIYDYVKAAAKHEPGMDALAAELAENYQSPAPAPKQQPDNPA